MNPINKNPKYQVLFPSNKPISKGEIILRHNTGICQELIRYIMSYWGDDITGIIKDWDKRMSKKSEILTQQIKEQFSRTDDELYDDNFDSNFQFEIRDNGSNLLTVKNIPRELVIWRKLNFNNNDMCFKFRVSVTKRHRHRYEFFSNCEDIPNFNKTRETGLFTRPIAVRRKDNNKLIQVYTNDDFIKANTLHWNSRYGQQQCNKLSANFIKLWKEGLVIFNPKNRIRHILNINKKGVKIIKNIRSHGLVLNTNKQNIIKNGDLYSKTGQELRDVLCILLHIPTGLKNTGKLKTKADIINKIQELRLRK